MGWILTLIPSSQLRTLSVWMWGTSLVLNRLHHRVGYQAEGSLRTGKMGKQALKLTRDVEREPFAKSAVSKWTVILFTAYDLCEPCVIFLMKQTVNSPLSEWRSSFFFPFFFSFSLFFFFENWTNSEVCKIFLFWDGQAPAVETNVQHHPVENTLCSLYSSYLSMSMWCFNILMVYGMF